MGRHTTLIFLVYLLTRMAAGWCEDWPTLCHDHARTGRASGAGPTAGRVAWSTALGSESVDGSPVVVGDTLYIGHAGGELCALQRATGAVVWRAATGGPIIGAAEVSNGLVFVGSVDGCVYALDAASGRQVWRHRTERPVLCTPACLGDRVIFGSTDGTMRAVAATTGKMIWRVGGHGPITAAPAVQDGVLYYGDEHGGLYARRAEDGTQLWAGKLAGRVIAAPTLNAGMLYVPLMSLSALAPPEVQFLTAWSIADGTKLWTAKPAAASVMGTPVCFEDRVWAFTVEGYVSEGTLRGLKLDTGEQLAELKLGRLVVDASLAVAAERLYLAAQNGMVYFVDARSGAVTGQVALGGKIFSSPAIADGRLYVGCQDGRVYCIE